MVLIIKCCVVQKQRRKITHIFLIDKIFRRVFVKKNRGNDMENVAYSGCGSDNRK